MSTHNRKHLFQIGIIGKQLAVEILSDALVLQQLLLPVEDVGEGLGACVGGFQEGCHGAQAFRRVRVQGREGLAVGDVFADLDAAALVKIDADRVDAELRGDHVVGVLGGAVQHPLGHQAGFTDHVKLSADLHNIIVICQAAGKTGLIVYDRIVAEYFAQGGLHHLFGLVHSVEITSTVRNEVGREKRTGARRRDGRKGISEYSAKISLSDERWNHNRFFGKKRGQR